MGGSASVVNKKKSYHSSEVKSMYAEHWDEGKHAELIDDEGMVCGGRLHDAVVEHRKSQALGEYDSKVDDENYTHDVNYEDSEEEEEGGDGPRPEQGIQRRSSAIAIHLAGRRQSTHRFEADRRGGSATQLEPISQRPPEQQEPPNQQQPSPGIPTISKRASFFSTPEQVSGGVGGS